MKQIIFLTILVYTLTSQLLSQLTPPNIISQRALGGANNEAISCVKNTSDGGYILSGVTTSKDGDVIGYRGGSSDLWIVNLNGNGSINWQKPLGGGNTEKATIVQEIKTNGTTIGYYVGGTTSSSNGDIKGFKGGASDIWVLKLDTKGNIIWQRPVGGSSMDEITSLMVTPDGGCIIGGNTTSINGDIKSFRGGTDMYLGKLSSAGILEWSRAWGSSGEEKMQDLEVLADGSCIAMCRTGGGASGGDITTFYGGPDLWLLRLDNAGKLKWAKTLGGSGLENVWATIKKTSDGNFIFGGGSDSKDGDVLGLNGDFGFWVVKLSDAEKGKIIWQWSDPLGGNLWDLKETTDEGFIICGTGSESDPATSGGALFVKLDALGNELWKKEYGGSSTDEPTLFQELPNGNLLSFGTTSSKEIPGHHNSINSSLAIDAWLLILDSKGQKLTEKAYGGGDQEWYGADMLSNSTLFNQNVLVSNYIDNLVDSNGDIFIGINTRSPDGDVQKLHYSSRYGLKYDIWFLKLGYNTISPAITKIEQSAPEVFSRYLKLNVYPNPARQSATILFTADQSAATTIEVYNILGARVRIERLEATNKGNTYEHRIDLSNMPGGTYLYQLRNGKKVLRGRFVKM